MNQTLKRRTYNVVMSIVLFIITISICLVSSLLIKKQYFDTIYVSGGSMNPTLVGGHDDGALAPRLDGSGNYIKGDTVNFGKVDPSNKAKKNIKRYDIVTTYFPSDYDVNGNLSKNADYKIKRVIALPGETFKIESGVLYVKQDGEFQKIERAHRIEDGGNVTVKDVAERSLGEGEYWVMGDHRNGSRDCVNFGKPVTFKNITGVLISIEGIAEYFVHYHCDNCNHEVDDEEFLTHRITCCDKCGGPIVKGKGDIRNRQYTYPKIV